MSNGPIIGIADRIIKPGKREFVIQFSTDRKLVIARMADKLHFSLEENGRPNESNVVSIGELLHLLGVAGQLVMRP